MRNTKRLTLLPIAAVLLAGCFTSERSLYGNQKPVTPLRPGAVESHDPVSPDKKERALLTLEADGVYRLAASKPQGEKSGENQRFRLFPLAGGPSDLLVAEVSDSCKMRDKKCEAKPARTYALIRLVQDGVEWRSPDCSVAMSKLSGISVKIDNCAFSDRTGLEKALRIAAAMPWKADGVYAFTAKPR